MTISSHSGITSYASLVSQFFYVGLTALDLDQPLCQLDRQYMDIDSSDSEANHRSHLLYSSASNFLRKKWSWGLCGPFFHRMRRATSIQGDVLAESGMPYTGCDLKPPTMPTKISDAVKQERRRSPRPNSWEDWRMVGDIQWGWNRNRLTGGAISDRVDLRKAIARLGGGCSFLF
jgi:hypothetical protein